MPKRIAIIGSVGVPANYGGFETLAEYLSLHLGREFQTTVYCSSKAYKNQKVKSYNGCKTIYIPLEANGMQSIPYDVLSMIHAFFGSKVFLVLGVAGSFVFPFIRLLSRKQLIVNIDGIEHRRAKWSGPARRYLRWAEALAVRFAHVVVADNPGIQEYVKDTYGKDAVVIPYGGDHLQNVTLSKEVREQYKLPRAYAFKVCRIEPENNIAMILEAFAQSQHQLVMVGNWQNSAYGQKLWEAYAALPNMHLLQPIYDQAILNQIRSGCTLYIHGHSAGGTNPSLVEAMYMGLPILAFDVNYNRYTTHNLAWYFSDSHSLLELLKQDFSTPAAQEKTEAMINFAREHYRWELIAAAYKKLMLREDATKQNVLTL
jgi:glycosyltransferase involved in cell wall biosynthesis